MIQAVKHHDVSLQGKPRASGDDPLEAALVSGGMR